MYLSFGETLYRAVVLRLTSFLTLPPALMNLILLGLSSTTDSHNPLVEIRKNSGGSGCDRRCRAWLVKRWAETASRSLLTSTGGSGSMSQILTQAVFS